MVVNYVGTGYKSVIKSSEYELIERLDDILYRLFKYYNDLFFKEKVQCYVCFKHTGAYFYDPYLFEFIIKNNVFTNTGSYVYIGQPIELPGTFAFRYDKTFFRAVEECNMKYFKSHMTCAKKIIQPFTLFTTRPEDYYYIDYENPGFYDEQMSVIDPDLVNAIYENRLFKLDHNKAFYNIIIKYFNNDSIKMCDINTFETLNELDSEYLYYAIPMVMYIIEKNIKNMLV